MIIDCLPKTTVSRTARTAFVSFHPIDKSLSTIALTGFRIFISPPLIRHAKATRSRCCLRSAPTTYMVAGGNNYRSVRRIGGSQHPLLSVFGSNPDGSGDLGLNSHFTHTPAMSVSISNTPHGVFPWRCLPPFEIGLIDIDIMVGAPVYNLPASHMTSCKRNRHDPDGSHTRFRPCSRFHKAARAPSWGW